MKCPSGLHDYVPEEDSVCTFSPEYKQECARCVRDQRDELLEACKMAETNLAPAYCSEHIVMKMLRVAIAKAEGK